MIRRDAQPIGNDPIYKRVKIGSDAGKPVDQRNVREAAGRYSAAEADRVWRQVVTTSAGTVAPVAEEPVTVTVEADEIDYTGVYGGIGY